MNSPRLDSESVSAHTGAGFFKAIDLVSVPTGQCPFGGFVTEFRPLCGGFRGSVRDLDDAF
ncbi:MAG: hypothetical protein KTR32_28580 [Granulosicoccus sp.]|nr:hypothetical protein [Granulosicoccus sp.]